MIKELKSFYKFSIVVFVLITGVAGYLLALKEGDTLRWLHLFSFLVGTFFLSAGSLSLNQIQEIKQDMMMERTQTRPLVTGKFSRSFALGLSLSHLILGSMILYFLVSKESFLTGLLIVFLYNGLYTLHWKKNWIFAAVPGAIPGALPASMGYLALEQKPFSDGSIYVFLVMFLWQMPHFWTLAIKYKDDYAKANFPILPTVLGTQKTVFHISFYVFAYILLAIFSWAFVPTSYMYTFVVLPSASLLTVLFFLYAFRRSKKDWLLFFLGTNFSLLIFLFAPVIDKWMLYYSTI